jgi:hypothetical protein
LFEISHADLSDKRLWIVDRRSLIRQFPRFMDLSIHLQPAFRPAILP